MKKIFLLLGAVAIISCNSNQKSTSSDSTKTDSTVKTTSSTSTAPKTAADSSKIWSYETDTDKMTSKPQYFAATNATNKLNFDSPYEGGSTATITIRTNDKKNEVLLTIDKGQFICDISDGCAVNIRFDNDPAVKFMGSGSSDGSSTVLFIHPETKFLIDIKKAKKAIVQAEFYQSGMREMNFDVAGLKWDH